MSARCWVYLSFSVYEGTSRVTLLSTAVYFLKAWQNLIFLKPLPSFIKMGLWLPSFQNRMDKQTWFFHIGVIFFWNIQYHCFWLNPPHDFPTGTDERNWARRTLDRSRESPRSACSWITAGLRSTYAVSPSAVDLRSILPVAQIPLCKIQDLL